MRSLQDRYQLSYVVISHDLSVLKCLADRIGVMYLGTLVEVGTSEQVYRAPRHPYTAGLIRAIPLPDPARERAKAASGLGGELPLAASGSLHAVACHNPLATDAEENTYPVTRTERKART